MPTLISKVAPGSRRSGKVCRSWVGLKDAIFALTTAGLRASPRACASSKDFVESKPDVLFAGSTPGVLALLSETRTIPIVFTNLNDPVATGAVASFARPGGNATGFTAFEYSLA